MKTASFLFLNLIIICASFTHYTSLYSMLIPHHIKKTISLHTPKISKKNLSNHNYCTTNNKPTPVNNTWEYQEKIKKNFQSNLPLLLLGNSIAGIGNIGLAGITNSPLFLLPLISQAMTLCTIHQAKQLEKQSTNNKLEHNYQTFENDCAFYLSHSTIPSILTDINKINQEIDELKKIDLERLIRVGFAEELDKYKEKITLLENRKNAHETEIMALLNKTPLFTQDNMGLYFEQSQNKLNACNRATVLKYGSYLSSGINASINGFIWNIGLLIKLVDETRFADEPFECMVTPPLTLSLIMIAINIYFLNRKATPLIDNKITLLEQMIQLQTRLIEQQNKETNK